MPTPAADLHARTQGPSESLLYASRACFDGPALAQACRIGRHAVVRNTALGISSALLYQSGWFLHWLEGPGRALDQLLTRIARDARHRNMRLLHRGPGLRELQQPWCCGVLESAETPVGFGLRIERLRRLGKEALPDTPSQWLRLLSAPAGLISPHAPIPAPEETRRLLVCASQAEQAGAFLRWLARRQRRAIGHGRFAGDAVPGLSIRYLDFRQQAQAWRVVAMPRQALHLGLVRALLNGCSQLLLLFQGLAAPDRLLMQELLLNGLIRPGQTQVLALGLTPALGPCFESMARLAGLRFRVLDPGASHGPAAGDWSGLWALLQEQARPATPDQ